MSKPLICIVGRSGCGKTTIANELEKNFNLVQVQSYTTRPPRTEDETGHTFISDAQYDALEGIVASTTFNGYRYATTKKQIEESDIYVVDRKGLADVINARLSRKIIAVYIDASASQRYDRMIIRGDELDAVLDRIEHDACAFKGTTELCDFVLPNEAEEDLNVCVGFIEMLHRFGGVR